MKGGKREGSGRKLGTANKKTREIADNAAAEGITPLEYMIKVYRDEDAEVSRRDDMAKAAAPYMHPRLANIESKVTAEQTVTIVSSDPIPEDSWEDHYSDHLATPAGTTKSTH